MQVNPSCPTCRCPVFTLDVLQEPERRLSQSKDASDRETGGRRRRKKRKNAETQREVGDDENLVQPKLKDSSRWIEQYDKNFPNQILLASAKTIAVKNQILIWQREAPEDKIIGKRGS